MSAMRPAHCCPESPGFRARTSRFRDTVAPGASKGPRPRARLRNAGRSLPDVHLGGNDPRFAGVLAGVGLCLLQARQYPESEKFLRESLAIRDSNEPAAWPTFSTRSQLGAALLGQKKYAEAET